VFLVFLFHIVRMPTYREKFLKFYGLPKDTSLSLDDISYLTDIKKSILQQVYNRGIGAWKTNISSVRVKGTFEKNPNTKKYPRSARLTKENWAMARVYSFVTGGKTSKTADADLAAMV
jgi:hypothetical protein